MHIPVNVCLSGKKKMGSKISKLCHGKLSGTFNTWQVWLYKMVITIIINLHGKQTVWHALQFFSPCMTFHLLKKHISFWKVATHNNFIVHAEWYAIETDAMCNYNVYSGKIMQLSKNRMIFHRHFDFFRVQIVRNAVRFAIASLFWIFKCTLAKVQFWINFKCK